MKKKILLGIVVGLQLLTLAAWAKDTVVVDRSVLSTAEQLNIDIPASTAPGFHDVQIQISDAAGVVSEKTIQFCKNLKGEIHWNNICPDLDQPFDPLSDPKGTTSIAVTALALLGAVGGSIAGSSGGSSEVSSGSGSKEGETDNDQSSLESIDAGELIALERAAGWGDKRRTWRAPLTSKVDHEFGLTAKQFSRFSPLMSRLLLDGTYLRSIIGSLEFLIYPLAIYVGFHTLNLNGWKAAPSTLGITIIGIVIGLIDAYAGFVIAYIFTIGVIVEGNFNSRHHILTTLGVSLLYFGPALISSALRPIRREVHNFSTLWERGTDYALAALLGGWASQKLVSALGGLSGFKLSIISHANQIGIIVGCGIIARMVTEDFGTYSYPVRHKSLLVELDSVKPRHKWFVLAVKTLLFFFTAEIFIGNCFALWLGTALYLVPTFIGKVGAKLSSPLISPRFLPKGAFKMLMMVIIGGMFGSILQSEITDNRTYAQTAFVILVIPGLLINSLYIFAGESQPTMRNSNSLVTRYLYRLLGLGVFITLIFIVKGNDVAGGIWNFISK
jgi:hypothetical protein